MRPFLLKTLFFWKIFWDFKDSSKTARITGLSSSMWKNWLLYKHSFSPPAMGNENLGGGEAVALVSMIQQSSYTTLFQGGDKWLQTWMSSAAGFLLFSKCFWRCCSWTFSASPEPKMPWKHRVMQDFRHFVPRETGLIMRGNRSVGGDEYGCVGPLCSTACLSHCSAHRTRVCHDLLKGHRPHQTILRSSTGFLNAYCFSKLDVSRWCITFHLG